MPKKKKQIKKIKVDPRIVLGLIGILLFAGMGTGLVVLHKTICNLKAEAIQRGYAIKDQGAFLWIETRRAAIP